MKKQLHILVLAILGIGVSCQSDHEAPVGPVYLKTLDLGEDFRSLGAFGLQDGSAIMTLYGASSSELVKIDDQGDIVWRSAIDGNVWCVWGGRPLSNGNILVYGFDCTTNNIQAGAVIYSPEGQLIHSVTFQNQVGTGLQEVLYSLDGMELRNGQIALVMPTITSAVSPTMVRLMQFDQELQLLHDRIYFPDSIVQNIRTRQISIAQDLEDNLLVQGRTISSAGSPTRPYSFVMKLNHDTYDPAYFETYGDNFVAIPSKVAAATDGAAVWAVADASNTIIPVVERFTLLQHEVFSTGTEIEVWKTDGPDAEIQTTVIRGFPKFGFIQQVRACSDGGFILTGTCNLNSNQEVPSEYRILLVKLDSNLKIEWMRVPDTHSAAVGADAVEIPGGFLVSGSHYSHNGYNNALVFKIDFDGLIR